MTTPRETGLSVSFGLGLTKTLVPVELTTTNKTSVPGVTAASTFMGQDAIYITPLRSNILYNYATIGSKKRPISFGAGLNATVGYSQGRGDPNSPFLQLGLELAVLDITFQLSPFFSLETGLAAIGRKNIFVKDGPAEDFFEYGGAASIGILCHPFLKERDIAFLLRFAENFMGNPNNDDVLFYPDFSFSFVKYF